MEVYSSKFVTVFFDAEKSLCKFEWKPETENSTDSDFKNWNQDLVKVIKQHCPKKLLSDNTQYMFTITPELQEWSASNVFHPMTEAGLRYLAMVVSQELFPQISLEQFSEENKERVLHQKFFKEIDEAKKWLAEK